MMLTPKHHQDRFLYSWKDYKDFISYARKRTISAQDYFSFEKYQGTLLVRYLQNMGIPVERSLALDIGCGFGGYTIALQEAGARSIGLDIDPVRISGVPKKVVGDATIIPFPAKSFSLVLCSSLIEHVPDPLELMAEIDRILMPKGYLYLSFPPFYSPMGGHQFAPFHYLGERLAISVYKKRKNYSEQEWLKRYLSLSPDSYTTSFGTWGLYRRTIGWAKKAIKRFPWNLIECSTRFSPVNTAAIPMLGEFMTWHVQFLVQRV